MRGRGVVRGLLSAGLLLVLAACAGPPWFFLPPGQLSLSNFRFDHANIEAVIATGPECAAPGAPATAFDLPFKGTRVIEAVPDADICWRRQTGAGQWTEWNRAYTATGRAIDSQL